MNEYVTVNFKTPDGMRNIRIKKDKKESVPLIKTGLMGSMDENALATALVGLSKMGLAPGGQELKSKFGAISPQGSDEGKIEVKVDGFELPDILYEFEPLDKFDEESIKKIDIKYPLIPQRPKEGEKAMAYAHIYYDAKINEPVYVVNEPPINDYDKKLLKDLKEYIQEKLDVNFTHLNKVETIKYITLLLEKAFGYFKVKENDEKKNVYKYYILRDFIGLGPIEPFMQDRQIEDISCDGIGIPIYIYHRNPKLGSIRTNRSFTSREELDAFVSRISERCGKNISVARPLLDGSLPDGSRVQATLGSDIARRGSNFTIRMFTEAPATPIDLINYGTVDLKMMAYYWFMIEHGSSVLISGGTASGKTTLLNALCLFIKPQMKIVSIEDTAEIRIPHAHWVPEVARTPIAEEGKVDMFELLRESLRQRPDYIIVGEVRGKEAYVLFQQIATGHPGLSTIHADSFQKLMDRLTSPPISLPAGLVQNLDLMLFIKRVKRGRRYARKVSQTVEVIGYDSNHNVPLVSSPIKWDPFSDKFKISGKSALLKKIANNVGMTEADAEKEIRNRAAVLEWLLNKNITDFRKVASVINLFYMSPDFLLQRIGA